MSEYRRSRTTRIKCAKRWIVGIFFALRLTDAFCFYLSIKPEHPVPAMSGKILVSVLWTTACLIALWLRKTWAKYVLIVFTSYVVFTHGMAIIVGLLEDLPIDPWGMTAIATRFGAYLAATVVLSRSDSIRALVSRPKSIG